MRKTAIRTVQHRTGERITLLFWRDPYQPVLLPFLWVTLSRRFKAYATIDKDVRSLQAFYEYCEQTGLNLESAVLELNFEAVLSRYESFGFWIKSKKKTDRIIAQIENVNSQNPEYFLGARAVNAYLGSIKTFLIWCIDRYISFRAEKTEWLDEIKQTKEGLERHLERTFSTHMMPVATKDVCNGLEPEHLQIIREHIHPDSPNNPYPVSARIRNWSVFNIFVETGMRRSELLKIQTGDCQEVNGRYFISLVDRTNDPTDTRKYEPGFKTLERTIEITRLLYETLDEYIDFSRRPYDPSGKLKILKHKYLFTNYLGDPISSKSINQLFEPLKSILNISDLSPHKLRNTFANDFLEFMVEKQNIGLESAQDKLRYIGGWHPKSTMPQRYGRKYIAKLANKLNRERVQTAWERGHKYE